MKLLHWIPCLLVFVLVGCGSNNGPQFSTRDSADRLIVEARTKLEETVDEGFGTPNDLVAWTQMEIDFGSFSGTVEAVGSTPGSAQVELVSVEGSALATDARLKDLVGAGVVIAAHKGVARVSSYEVVDDTSKHTIHRLQIVDDNGAAANVDFVKYGSLWLDLDDEKLGNYEMNADDLASSLQVAGLIAQVRGDRFEVSNGTDKLTWSDIENVEVPYSRIVDMLTVEDPIENAGQLSAKIDVTELMDDFGLKTDDLLGAIKKKFANAKLSKLKTELSEPKLVITVTVKKTEEEDKKAENADEFKLQLEAIPVVTPIPISMGQFVDIEAEERDDRTVLVLTPDFDEIDKFPPLSVEDVIRAIEEAFKPDESKPDESQSATLTKVGGVYELVPDDKPADGNKIVASDVEDLTLFIPAFKLSDVATSKVAYHDVKVVGAGLQYGRDLYLRHCMHCHGVSGDGAGPTAEYLNPLPRDYRDGIIKFTSTGPTLSPNRDDLYRVVKLGVPGTYMPSFMLLPDDDVKAIAEYVRFLATRGQIESQLLNEMSGDYSVSEDETAESMAAKQTDFATFVKEDFADALTEAAEFVAGRWGNADDPANVVTPAQFKKDTKDEDGKVLVVDIVERPVLEVGSDEFKASLKRGRELFLSVDNKCAGCHGEKGRGDGALTEGHVPVDGVPAKEPGYFDDWGNRVKPRNLTQGFFRGGRRPIDIYRRIRIGIKGTPMPANKVLTNEDTWHLINYVLNIPFED